MTCTPIREQNNKFAFRFDAGVQLNFTEDKKKERSVCTRLEIISFTYSNYILKTV